MSTQSSLPNPSTAQRRWDSHGMAEARDRLWREQVQCSSGLVCHVLLAIIAVGSYVVKYYVRLAYMILFAV
jgi:hypothetical protein